ncbi:MAG: hypothetical protein J6T74_03900, partial [Clostridia bacterium]|nr:hypothetical protein [Clostridia bacterium]
MKKILSIFAFGLVFICMAVFAGCEPTNSSFSLSFNDARLELLITDEYKEFSFVVGDYNSKDIDFDFSFESSIVREVADKTSYLSDGKFTFRLQPLAIGETKLTLTIRGTDVSLSIPVVVGEEIKGITAKDNVYIKRGSSRVMTSADFIFNPEYTTQTGLLYRLQNEDELALKGITWNSSTATLSVAQTSNDVNEVNIVATSIISSDITTTLVVKIVDAIDVNKLNLEVFATNYYGDSEEDLDASTRVVLYSKDALELKNLDFTINDVLDFKKQISVKIDDYSKYSIDVSVDGAISGDVCENAPIRAKQNNFTFDVQTDRITNKGETFGINIKVYQTDFVLNYQQITIPVTSKMVPKTIRINGQDELCYINLYDNNTKTKTIKYSIYPNIDSSYNNDNYIMQFKLYRTTSKTSVSDDDLTNFYNFSDFLNIIFNDNDLSGLTNEADEYLANVSQNENTFVISAKRALESNLVIKATCIDKTTGEEICSNMAFIKVYQGSRSFYIDSTKYVDNTLYVKMPDIGEGSTTYSFDDFELEGGTVGRLYVTPKFSTMLSCDVSVDLLAEKPTLRITPRSVGKSDFIISTENELPPITISIVVYREITKDDFSLTVLNTDSRNLYDYSIKEQTNSIEHFSVKGKGVSINIKERIKDYTDTNKDSYGYSISLKNNSCFGLMENSNGGYTITSNDFTQNAEIVKVSLITYSSEGFIRTANEEIINVFDFNISCIDYVKDMNLTTSRDELDSNSDIAKKLKTIDVYNYNDLSYANKNLATARLYLDVQMSDNDNVVCTRKDLETNGIGFYVEQSDGEGSMLTLSSTLKLTKITEDCYKVGDVGNLYISQETDYFIAYFICDYSGINVVSDFMFTATIEDKIGYSYTASVSVNIKKYVDVDGLFLVNAMEYMYLDNTETNRQLTLNTYILPANAMLKDIVVRIEYDDADSTNCLSYTINDTKVTFTYLKGGTGTVRIFAVSRMKTNSERDEFGAYYYNIALKFNCADGTSEKKALRLLSYEDLLRFDANNHYYLDTLIDCRGNEVYFPELKNSIRGTFLQKDDENFGNDEQTGGIINFVVANKGLSSGLFGTIKDTAKIYNLVISGNFKSGDFKGMNQTSDIGLLAGINKGTISNVQVSLSNSANNTLQISKSEQATGTVFISFGMLAGANYGTIEINNDAKISTLFVDMSNIPLRIEVSGISDVSVGGVVGKNVEGGNIFNNYLTDSYSSIGLFGINAHVNITANVGYLGAIVGSNTGGTVSSIKAQGIVRNNNSADNSYVGGILGFMDGGTLEKCTSRIYVRGAKYASGLIGHINAGIVKDNTVQATDNGEKRGIEATLVYAYGENVNAYGLTDDDTKLGEENHAYTYMLFSRTVRVIGTEEMVNQSLSIDYYYGDILVLDANETTIKVKKDMEDGSEQISMQSVSLAPLVLSAYKKAKNPSQQSILLNDIDTETLLLLAGVSLSEMSLNIDNTSLAMLKNYGRYISVNGTGVIQLKASSSLNYKAYALITIYLIEYFEEITAYLDKGMSNAVGELKLVNQNTTAVYMRGYTHNYKYKNTQIELEDNQQLEYVIITEDDIIDIESNGYIAYFTAKASISTKSTNIVVKPIIKIGNNEYYGKYVQGLGVNVFLSNIDEDKQIATRFSAKVLTGIQNIKSDKNTIMAEPSDNVSFNVSYTTYNKNDNLSAEAFIVFGNNSSEILASSYNEEDGSYTFIKSNGPLFVLQKDIAQSIDLGGEIYQVVQSYNVYATLSYSA